MAISIWVWSLLGISIGTVTALAVKIMLMRKAAYEIRDGVIYRLQTDTNTLLDISSRDKAMLALAQGLNEELRTLRRQRCMYEQGNLALSETVTNLAHDLRTPLTAISGYLELLEKEEAPENIRRYLNIISERTAVLTSLSEELFRYALTVPESVAGFVAYHKNEVYQGAGAHREDGTDHENAVRSAGMGHNDGEDIGRLIEECVLAYYGALTQKGIDPVINLPDKKIKSRIDNKITCRIFENIISNALKYSDGDLRITLTEEGEVIFANHASSLDAVQTGRLFDRFYTVENGKTSTGLGLAIARQLTEQTGGDIAAWYEEGMLYLRLRFPMANRLSPHL